MNLKKGKSWGAAVILAIVLLSSCKSLKNTNTLFQSEYDKFADTVKTVYVGNQNLSLNDSEYKIQPHDVVALRNLQNPEGPVITAAANGVQNAAVFRADLEGNINLPVIGIVRVSGLTLKQAATKIQDLYGKSLLKNPIIDLTLVNYKVTLLGEVTKPGNFMLERENIDLVELIGTSGGLLSSADPRRIKIIRGNRANPQIIFVNLKNAKTLSKKELILQNNDIVYIPQQNLYNINEGIKSYTAIIQPAILLLNTVILISTLKKL
jgi:polysaccharide biosynthesis/export protein